MYDSAEVRQIVTPTPYCWPLMDLEELRVSSHNLRTRITSSEEDYELQGVDLPELIDRYLGQTGPGGSGCLTPQDETRHSVLFLHLLPPLPKERKHSMQEEEPPKDVPLLVAILLPEMACNISEVEAQYHFSTKEIIEESLGPDAVNVYEFHRGTTYINMTVVFHVLLQQHPALLVALSQSIIRPSPICTAIREIIHGGCEAFQKLLESILERVYSEVKPDSIDAIQTMRLGIIHECQTALKSLLHIEGEGDNSLLSPVLEAFDVLLGRESESFEGQYNRMRRQVLCRIVDDSVELEGPRSESDNDEDIGRKMTGELVNDEMLISIIHRLFNLTRIVGRRLRRLTHVFPTD